MPFTVRVTDAQELERGEDPAAVAVENALRKARSARRAEVAEAVLGCDTIVVLDGTIYGKPPDPAAARATIAALAGRTHEVISGVAVLLGGPAPAERTAVARTRVTFRAMDAARVERYVGTGEWRGRSGGYAIQGEGSRLVQAVDGELENVVGLPLGLLPALCPELLGPDARS